MNNLNSIIVEGIVSMDPYPSNRLGWDSETAPKVPTCDFSIINERCYRIDGELKKHTSLFNIIVSGRLAETCLEQLHRRRGVRIVGRLEENSKQVSIVAEHVEFKPVFAKQEPAAVEA